jgi:hypothetical protein
MSTGVVFVSGRGPGGAHGPPYVPEITSISPTSGNDGDTVEIMGRYLTGATAVYFAGLIASCTVNNDTSITTTVPDGAGSGPISVRTPVGTGGGPWFELCSGDGGVSLVSIAVSPLAPSLDSGDTQQMVATGTYADASTLNLTSAVTWESSDTGVATIDNGTSGGVLSALGEGTTTVSATIGAVSGSTDVDVSVPANAPVIDSYSPSSGQVGDSITITGLNFTGSSAVTFNGTSASFVVNSNTEIVATVPSGATTGVVRVTGAEGIGTGPSFTVNANNFAFDLTTTTFPAGLDATRTGDTLYPDRSATTAAAQATAEVFENHGDTQGGGHWTFPSFRNGMGAQLNSFSALVGWVYTGAPTYTANDAVAPDGSATADRITDPGAGASADISFDDSSETSAEPLIATVWVKDVVGSEPSATGALSCIGKLFSESLATGASWRRVASKWIQFSVPQGRKMVIMPAGAAVQADLTVVEDAAATGAIHLWGAQATKGLALLPTVAGESGDLTISATTPSNALAVNGDFHVEGAFLMDTLFNNGAPPGSADPFILFSMATPSGEFRLEYSDQVINGYLNGANIIGGVTFTKNIGYLAQGGELRWEIWNRPTSGADSGMQFWLSGERADTVRATSVTQATPTTFNLGHQAGAKILPRRHTLLRKTARDIDAANGVILGDSIVAAYSSYSSVGSRILTATESRSLGIVSYAYPGQTVTQQTTAWTNAAQRGDSAVEWIIVHVGVNDFIAGDSAATVTTRLQTLITDINTQNPTAKILLSPILPCKANASIGATIWARIETYNDNIAGTGGTPITGSNITVIAYWTAMDDGAGNMIAAYELTDTGAAGDGLHENTAGRIYVAGVYRAALVALGFL